MSNVSTPTSSERSDRLRVNVPLLTSFPLAAVALTALLAGGLYWGGLFLLVALLLVLEGCQRRGC